MNHAPPVLETRGRPGAGGATPDPRASPSRGVRSSRATRAARPDREVPILLALVVALGALFVVAPASLAGSTYGRSFVDDGRLVEATRGGLAEFWAAGREDLTPSLRSAVDYWARYHVAKAVIAALLLGVLVVLGLHVRRALSRPGGSGRGRRARLTAAALGVASLTLVAAVLLMANVQGAFAPLSSLLSVVGPDQRGGDLAATVDQIRQGLAPGAGPHAPALQAIVDDFARYHAVFAVLAVTAAAGLAVFGVTAWRACSTRRDADLAARRVLRVLGIAALAVALLMAVVAMANVSNATGPEEGLRIFFGGA